VNAAAIDRHEADAARARRLGNVVDRKPGGPVARCACRLRRTDDGPELTAVISALIGELGRREHVLGMDDEEQIVVGLEMDVPRAGRGGDIRDRARILGVAHVDDAESFREHVPDIGVAAMHHDLDAVRPATLIAMADEAHVVRMVGFRQLDSHR
jgi:hypothetical protein